MDKLKTRRVRHSRESGIQLHHETLDPPLSRDDLFRLGFDCWTWLRQLQPEAQPEFTQSGEKSNTAKHERQRAGGWKPPSVGQHRPSSASTGVDPWILLW